MSRAQIALAMAKMGANLDLLQLTLDLADITLTPEQCTYLRGPLITCKGEWGRSIPDWVRPNLRHARLSVILGEIEQPTTRRLASDMEVMLILMSVSMEAPLSTEWVNVYTWVGKSAYQSYHADKPDSAWQGISPDSLTIHERDDYLYRLSMDIREKVVKGAPKLPQAEPPLKPVQYSFELMFDL